MAGVIRHKPIYVVCEPGVPSSLIQVVMEGIQEVLDLARAADAQIEVKNFGIWREDPWRQDDQLLPHRSVDWYLQFSRENSRQGNQLSTVHLMHAMLVEPLQTTQPHYDVMILHSDIYWEDCIFIIGQAMAGILSIISVHRFLSLDSELSKGCVKTETMHEIGHMFGLPSEQRSDGTTEESIGLHCTNTCIMRQGLTIPKDFVRLTKDRLARGPFCATCLRELRQFFI